MKIKSFNEHINEGKDRVEIDGNHVVAGEATLPSQPDDKQEQPLDGVDIESFVQPEGSAGFLTDAEDHLSQKKVDKLVEPHIKKFADFGFDPNDGNLTSTHSKVKDNNELK